MERRNLFPPPLQRGKCRANAVSETEGAARSTTSASIKVTRANEARRMDFANQVREEHEKIVSAIAAGDPERARVAAGDHMLSVAARVRLADREFWRGNGGALARDLVRDFGE